MIKVNEIKSNTSVGPIAYKTFTDNETGEVFDVPLIIHNKSSNSNFEMIFYGHFLDILDDLGNKRIQILRYIVKNRDPYTNTLIKTVKEIADALFMSTRTVNDTLIILTDKGAIKRKTGVIFLDANLICDGRFKGKIMHIYNTVEEETSEEKQARLEREIKRKTTELDVLKALKDKMEVISENQMELEFA